MAQLALHGANDLTNDAFSAAQYAVTKAELLVNDTQQLITSVQYQQKKGGKC